jgi:hypothetical protein
MVDRGWILRQYAEPRVIHHLSPQNRDAIQDVRGHTLNSLRFLWWYHPVWVAAPYSAVVTAKFMAAAGQGDLPFRGIMRGLRDFIGEMRSGLRRTPMRSESLKIFHGMHHRNVFSQSEMQRLAYKSWGRMFVHILFRRKRRKVIMRIKG